MIEPLKERLAHQDGSLDHLDWSSAALKARLLSSCRMKHAKFSIGSAPRRILRILGFECGRSLQLADLREAHFARRYWTMRDFDRANLRERQFRRAVAGGQPHS